MHFRRDFMDTLVHEINIDEKTDYSLLVDTTILLGEIMLKNALYLFIQILIHFYI